MVLTGDPAAYVTQNAHFFADVFEPCGFDDSGLPGGWSSMCGNGLMAVSLFFEEYHARVHNGEKMYFQTRSGLRISTKLGQGSYSVQMGEFTHRCADLRRYVALQGPKSTAEWLQISAPHSVGLAFCDTWSIGFSGDRQELDGEPHVVLFGQTSSASDLDTLRAIAMREGPLVTKNRRAFPREVNTNFAIVQANDEAKREISVLACTHERGLGDDPDRSVTGACGTGATAIAATLYRLHNLEDSYMVTVTMPGGVLRAYREHGQFYLIGSAHPITCCCASGECERDN